MEDVVELRDSGGGGGRKADGREDPEADTETDAREDAEGDGEEGVEGVHYAGVGKGGGGRHGEEPKDSRNAEL